MRVIYISENKDTCDVIKRIIEKTKRIFNIIERKQTVNNTIYYLPVFKNTKLTKYRIRRITTKISKLLDEDESNIVALSQYLNEIVLFKNCLYSNNIDILNGRFLFKCLTNEIIEKIFKVNNIKKEQRRGNSAYK